MDAVLLTYRWQNIFAIWIMVGILYLLCTVGNQVALRYKDGSNGDG
jgi:hypothetical protein